MATITVMTLQEFKRSHDLSYTDLAELLGFPVSTVHGWFTGARQPDPNAIAQIVERTKGEVTAGELRPDLAALFAPTAAPATSAA